MDIQHTRFQFNIQHFPVFYSKPSQPLGIRQYRQVVRGYYAHIRQNCSHTDVIDHTLNLTAGELALYILHTEHESRIHRDHKRQKISFTEG